MADAPEILALGLPSGYEVENLARVFFPGAKARKGGTRGTLVYARAGRLRLAVGLRAAQGCTVAAAPWPPVVPPEEGRSTDAKAQTLALCRLLYRLLARQTGLRPPWGLLTGVRPLNLYRKRLAAGGEDAARRYFLDSCFVSEEKFAMTREIEARQRPLVEGRGEGWYSLYVSIPFCPTRCAYCSFVSRTVQREGHLVQPYLEKLAGELALTAQVARDCGLRLASIYVGGGTPTALSAAQLDALLAAIARSFDTAAALEYTVEAGRPDCTDLEKLRILKNYGVGRISINPQTMRDGVLQAIGRRHTAEDVRRCFADARKAGHGCINMDLIAGLPGDDVAGFAASLAEVAALGPENVTLHTLTMKRASDLVVDRREVDASPGGMLEAGYQSLANGGYAPYYLYRQKSGVENLENTGWTLPGAEGLYNIFIMEEVHTILACGAGASSKVVRGGQNLIRRLYNHKFPADYIARFDEIIERKEGVRNFYAGNLDSQAPG